MIVTAPPLEDRHGVALIDPIERRRFTLYSPNAVTPEETATTDEFPYPVDVAFRVRTAEVTLPTVVPVHVRDADGRLVETVEDRAETHRPSGAYTLELCTPIKVYLVVESGVRIAADAEQMRLSFDDGATVLVGVRSKHTRPEATVRTPEDSASLMRAISTFGSALKTTSPERSFPTLRGHPPLIEFDASLDEPSIPGAIERPESGLRIEVPPELAYVYPVAPLAYYLAAEVVPGSTPRIVTDDGYEHSLEGPGSDGFEARVADTLKQLFCLDCVTRTEGLYPVSLHEREAIEPRVDLTFDRLYDAPLAERTAAYLDVPFDALEPHLPDWKLTAHVAPEPGSAPILPFLVDDLGIVYTPPTTATPASSQRNAVDDFLRGPASGEQPRGSGDGTDEATFVTSPATDAMEQTWVGDGTPLGASEALLEAFHNRLGRSPTPGDIDIVVVCNDERMTAEEDVVDDVYGSRSDVPFNVDVHRNATTAAFRSLLDTDAAFLHYIGHVDVDGFECADGTVDATAVERTRIDAFLLNACTSYRQGRALIEAGAVGGVVTLREVVNAGAVKVGGLFAQLLNGGFPLRPALELAREEHVIGSQYMVVGDGGVTVTQPQDTVPNLYTVERASDGEYTVAVTTYATRGALGSIFVPYLPGDQSYHLVPGEVARQTLDESELREFLALSFVPVRYEGDLYWNDELLEQL